MLSGLPRLFGPRPSGVEEARGAELLDAGADDAEADVEGGLEYLAARRAYTTSNCVPRGVDAARAGDIRYMNGI